MTEVNERIATRRREVRRARRRRRLRRTVIVTTVAALAVGAVLVERSELVALASIEVVGTQRLDEATVVDASGVELGTSVLRLRLGRVETAVEDLPLVDDATVERDGALGLRIVVNEVAPALTATYGRVTVLVSVDGLVLGEGTAEGLPAVVVDGAAPRPGTTWDDLPALRTAATVAFGLPGPLASLVATVHGLTADEVELVLTDGTVVRWGDQTAPEEKARALGAVLEDLDGRSVTAIDVRAPMAPTFVP